jgi:pyridoxal phosphate enzyme (YggS family)
MSESENRVESYRAARERVLERIAAACARAGRDPSEVTLIAVSKTVPAEALRDAVAAGLELFGENRVQEALAKAPEVAGAGWHLVGPLQSNKARRALEIFDSISTVDSLDLARRLDRLVPEVRPVARYPVLVQVNVDLDPAKAGFAPGDLDGALGELLELPHLAVGGLMTVGRLTTDPAETRRTFRDLRELGERCRSRWPALGPGLSMGMSDDFEIAIEEGATIVRVGRALFGERAHFDHPHPGDTQMHGHHDHPSFEG